MSATLRLSPDAVKRSVSIADVAASAGLVFDERKSNRARGELWACCPFHEERTPSFKIDEPRQNFYCFGCGERGDAIDLTQRLRNCSFREALEALGDGDACAPSDWEERRRKAEREHGAAQRQRIAQARELWEESSAPEPGGVVRSYLAWRGLPAAVAAVAVASGELREHRDKWGRVAMLVRARHNGSSGEPSGAIQRTGLCADGRGKRALDSAGLTRRSLGPVRDCSVRLMRPFNGELAIAEGVETALSFFALHKLPTWAALGTSGLRSFTPPPKLRRLVIAADNGAAGQDAARALYHTLKTSLRVVIASPSEGDWNDALQLKNQGFAR